MVGIQALETMALSAQPLPILVANLRELKSQGLTRDQAYQILEGMRDRAVDEPTEDRILEVMDIVSGFCSQELTVWD